MEHLAQLLELYEYKVADVLSGRDPRGGRRSVVELRDILMSAQLDSTLLKRFTTTDRSWRTLARVKPGSERVGPGFIAAPRISVNQQTYPYADEDAATEQLAYALWHMQAGRELRQAAQSLAREPQQLALRCLFALSLNLETGTLHAGVPREHDPLVSLDNPAVAESMLLGLLEQLLAYRSDTATPLDWARAMAAELANNPNPAKSRHTTISDTELGNGRRTESSSRASTARAAVKEALDRGLDLFAGLLPSELGGRTQLDAGRTPVLHGRNPDRRASGPDPARTLLAVHLLGAGELRWHGHTIGWQPLQGGWQMLAHGATYPMQPAPGQAGAGGVAVARIPLENMEFRGAQVGAYLLLEAAPVQSMSLYGLLALARPVSVLLEPGDDHLHLRLARAVAQWLRDGRVDAAALGPDSAAKYASAPPDVLQSFARKGAENLVSRLRRLGRQDVQRAFGEAARALGCSEARALAVMEVVYSAVFGAVPPEEAARVGAEREHALIAYRGDPVTVEVMDRSVTLRTDYKGEVAAVLPGAPAQSVRDLVVFSVPRGGILIARQGMRIALGFQEAVGRTASSGKTSQA